MSATHVLRVVFRNGVIREERGTETDVQQLFAQDEQVLLDHVLSLNLHTGEQALWCHTQDTRFDAWQW